MKQLFRLKTSTLLLCVFLLSACNKNGSNGYGSNNGNNSNNTSTNSVSISGMAFNSSNITVKPGITVTWTNNEYMKHTVTADDNSFTSGDLNYGDKFTHTFNSAGTYSYHCQYHASMTGAVNVNQ